MAGRQPTTIAPTRTVKRLAAALEPPARGSAAALPGAPGCMALAVALVLLAELRLDGGAAIAVRAAAVAALGGVLLLALRRLRLRVRVAEAVASGLEDLGEAVMVVDDATSRILHAGPAAAGIYGRPVAELVGADARDLVGSADRPTVEARRRLRAAGHKLPGRMALPIAGPDGEERHVEWAAAPLDLDGRRLLVAVARDITGRVEEERRTAAEQRVLRAAFDAGAQPVAVLDAAGRILRANATALRLAGRDEAQLKGRTPAGAGLATREQVAEVAAGLRAGRDPFHLVLTWQLPGEGERVVAWSLTVLRDDDGAVHRVIAVGRDLTGLRAAEARARRAHAALDVRSKELERSKADLAELAGLASDDLRAPIRAVSGFGDLLEAHAAPALEPRDRSHLTALREAAGHAEELLDGLAAYGRLAHGEALARDVDCERALDEVLADVAHELAAREAVVTRDPLPVVPGDPGELRVLLGSLVVDAVRHGAAERPRVHVGAQRRGLGWQLTVAGDGDGVPAAERQRILQRSRRPHARGAHRGSGVGLALCRRIVERHGGAIWVDDAAGGGSVFCVSLPDREAR